jgi:hypothetical protein
MPIDWQALDEESEIEVPAKPAKGIWTPVRSYVSNPTIIRIEAEGEWKPVEILPPCTADGFRHWAFGRDLLLTKKAPLGALIGKIGGSNIATDETEIFLVGSSAVISVEKSAGPLWLTINDAPWFFEDNSGILTVQIK